MILVLQNEHVTWNVSAFQCVSCCTSTYKILGVLPDDSIVTLASYSCPELAELDFNLLKKAIEKGSKIFYFSREEEAQQ